MQIDLVAKLKDLAAFRDQYEPGDEKRLFGGKPLIFAALSNNKPGPRFEISDFLLERGATVTGANAEGDGALSIVLSRKTQDISQTTELVKRLVAAGADPTTRDDRGATPTQLVAQLPQDDDEIQDLLDFWFSLPGLAPTAPNTFGKSPIELAGGFPQRADRVRRMKRYGA